MSIKVNTVIIFFDKKNNEFYITKSVLDNLNLSTNNSIFKDGLTYCRIDPNIVNYMINNQNTPTFPYSLDYRRIDVEKGIKINIDQSSNNIGDTNNRGNPGQVESQRREKKELVFFYNQNEDYYFTTSDVLTAANISPVSRVEYKGAEYYKVQKSYVDMLERISNESNNQFKVVVKNVSITININSNGNSSGPQKDSSGVRGVHVGRPGEVSNIMKQVRINIGQDNSVTTKYNYGQYQGRVEAFLSRIYRDSKDWFEKPSNLDSVANLVKLVGFLDLYLHYYYEVHRDKFDYVFEAISGKSYGDTYEVNGIHGDYDLNYDKEKNQKISNLYGNAHSSGCFIDMNTTLPDKMLFLYLAHELGHVVNRRSLAGIDIFSDKLNNSFSSNNPVTYLNNTIGTIKFGSVHTMTYNSGALSDGVRLLDEAITQDRAEDIAVYYTGGMRRKVSEVSTPFYDGKTCKSNFAYYGEFEEPAVLFGSVIDEVGAIDDFEEAMRRISTLALSSELSDRVIDSFKNNEENLLKLLTNMGIIKGKKYSSLGVGTGCPEEIINSKSTIEAREDIARIVNNIKGYGNSSGFKF